MIVILSILVTIVITCSYGINVVLDKKNRTRHSFKCFMWVLGGLWLLALILIGLNTYDHRDSKNVRVALKLTRLPNLPKSAKVINTKVHDSLFSLTVWVTYQAPLNDIKVWLAQAKELKSKPNDHGGISVYEVPQDDLANWGRIEVNEKTKTVTIQASHS